MSSDRPRTALPTQHQAGIQPLGRIHDGSVRWLPLAQALTLFVALPLSALHLSGLLLADLCRVVHAGACIRAFTGNRLQRAPLAAAPVLSITLPGLYPPHRPRRAALTKVGKQAPEGGPAEE